MINLYTYRLPFKKPFITGKGKFHTRTGLLIHFSDSEHESLAETSPLPGFSLESTEDVKEVLISSKSRIDTFLKSDFNKEKLLHFLNSLPKIASLQFALSFIGVDLLIKRNKSTFGKLFGKSPSTALKVNTVIGTQSPVSIYNDIKEGIDDGFDTFKLKAAWPVKHTVDAIRQANKEFSNIVFRLDANQSWPAEGIKSVISSLKGLPIEYIEEPARFRSRAELSSFVKNSTIPIALDESLVEQSTLLYALEKLPGSVLIIKPTLHGNLFEFYETITRYRSLVNDIVVTTTLESAVGRNMVLNIASLIGDPNRAHGLNTGHLFEKDLHPGFTVKQGLLTLPSGRMVSLDLSELNNDLIQPIT